MKASKSVLSAAILATMAVSGSAQAAALSWNGLTSTFWSEATNWSPSGVPVSGDTLTFGTTTGTRTANNDIVGLTFSQINISGNSYAIGGPEGISMNGTISFTAGTSNISTVSVPINLVSDLTIDVAATTSGRLQSDGTIAGNFGLTKIGTGMFRLTGSVVKAYTGNTTISAGTFDIAGGGLPNGTGKGDVYLNSGATLNANNTAYTINGLNDGTSGGGNLNKGGSNSRTVTIGAGDANGSFSGSVNFTGGTGTTLAKTGAGTQILAGNAVALPNLAANGGRLLVNGNFGVTGATTVGAAGLLGGSGTVGNATVNGKLAPGGTLAGDTTAVFSTGNLTLSATGEVDFDIDGLARGTEHDGVNLSATGVLNYGGGKLVLDIGAINAGTYDLFRFTVAPAAANLGSISVTGAISGSLTGSAGIWTGTFGSATLTFSESTGDLVIAIPEPTSLAAVGLLTLLTRRRRDR